MNCEFKNREAIIEKYLAKALPESEQNVFEEHYFSCEECFNELETSKRMIEMFRNEGRELFPEYSKKSKGEVGTKFTLSDFINKTFPPKWYLHPSSGYVFVVATILLAGLYFLYPSSDDKNSALSGEQVIISENNSPSEIEENPAITEETDAKRVAPTSELYAANFVVSADLENLINQGYRNKSFIKVLSPETGITVKDEVLFNFESESEEQLFLKILNNQEEVLYKFTLDKKRLLFSLTENEIDPGLYYWKLENEEELLHLSKFYIKPQEKN